MEKAAGRILKREDVNLEGQFRLDVNQNITNSANKQNPTSAEPNVCIAENKPEFAVMEVTCCCGAKTHIRCEYTNVKSTEQQTVKENSGENENESK